MSVARHKYRADKDRCVDKTKYVFGEIGVVYKPCTVEYGVVCNLSVQPAIIKKKWQIEGTAKDKS